MVENVPTATVVEKEPVFYQGAPKKTFPLVPFIGIVLFGVCVVLSYIVITNLRGNRMKEANQTESAPSVRENTHMFTMLSVLPQSVSKESLIAIPIQMQTGENVVSAVELHISVNPWISGVSISPGGYFENPTVLQKKIDENAKTIIYTVGSLQAKKGEGTVAMITVPRVPEGVRSIDVQFLPNTKVAAIGETSTVLKQAQGGVITLK